MLIDKSYESGLQGFVFRGLGIRQFRSRIIAGDSVLVGIFSANNCGQRGASKGGWYVSVSKDGTLTSKTIDVRCVDRGMPHEPVVRPRLIVGNQENDVGGSRVVRRFAGSRLVALGNL